MQQANGRQQLLESTDAGICASDTIFDLQMSQLGNQRSSKHRALLGKSEPLLGAHLLQTPSPHL